MAKKSDSILELNLMAQTKNELQEAAEFFGVLVRSSDRKAVMVEKLLSAYRTDTLRCLKRLPVYELRTLQLLISQGKGSRMLVPEPLPPFFTLLFGLMDDVYDWDETDDVWGGLMEFHLEDEVYDLFVPHIDSAIREVEESGRVEFERFLWGCLTIYGYLSVREFTDLWCRYYPEEPLKSLYDFMDIYAPFPYLTDDNDEYLLYPDLDRIDLYAEQQIHGTYGRPLAAVSLDDILSAGKTTPYNFPFVSHKEGVALAEALKAVGHGGDAGAIRMHRIWKEIQMGEEGEEGFKNLVQDILHDVRVVSVEKSKALGRAIEDYSNAIPVWAFRGLSSVEMLLGTRAGQTHEAITDFVKRRMDTLLKAASVPRVGCNDPCPCGSGKKYKDCHGKNHN